VLMSIELLPKVPAAFLGGFDKQRLMEFSEL
jgi:hypothetical protein